MKKDSFLLHFRGEAKKQIDISQLPEEYRTAIQIQISNSGDTFGQAVVDYDGDLEVYRGLDPVIGHISPQRVPKEHRNQMQKLFEICPNIKVSDEISKTIGHGSTVQDYFEAEEWIESVLEGINPEWADVQKVAYIDNAIGRRISYSPDYKTDVFNANDARALWRIISSGYGVCNGVSQIAQYMLGRVGINSEIIGSKTHAFLLIKGIELPTENGETIVGDTILDSTWNLTANRFGGLPQNFCLTYEEIRKRDIVKGKDEEIHLVVEKIGETIGLTAPQTRGILASIGLADQYGRTQCAGLMEASNMIYQEGLPLAETVKRQLNLLEEYYPQLSTCPFETIDMIGTLLDPITTGNTRCCANRVVERTDTTKRPVIYVYVGSKEEGELFYYLDTKTGHFTAIEREDFEERFECYTEDLKKNNGIRPWDQQPENSVELVEIAEDKEAAERENG
ncbi:MAG: hypothetical protein IKP28_06700 [Clostridia bacterium]|nr:hypothetical protein [Clostridia bacterium]